MELLRASELLGFTQNLGNVLDQRLCQISLRSKLIQEVLICASLIIADRYWDVSIVSFSTWSRRCIGNFVLIYVFWEKLALKKDKKQEIFTCASIYNRNVSHVDFVLRFYIELSASPCTKIVLWIFEAHLWIKR